MTSIGWRRLPLLSIGHQTWLFMIRIFRDIGLTIWLWISLFFLLKSIPLVVLSMICLVGGVGVMVCFVRWFFFYYRFTADAVEIQEGVFSRTNKKIPYCNVINVEINRPFLFRMTRYVEAIFDTAGHSKKDGVIPCIEREIAEDVKSRCVGQHQDQHSVSDSNVLIERQLSDLFIFGMAHNRVFLFLGLLVGLYYKVKEVVQDLDNQLLTLYQVTLDAFNPQLLIGSGIVVLLLASSVLSGLIQVVKSFQYRLFLADDGKTLKQTEGLFTKLESTISREKLQRVVIRRTLLDRLVGRCSMELVQLNSSMIVPALRPSEIEPLCHALNVRIAQGNMQRGGLYSSTKWSALGALLFIFLAYEAFIVDRWGFAYSFFAFSIALIIHGCFRWYRYGFVIDESSLCVKSGRIDERVFLVDLLKCQAVTVSQSWIEQVLGISSVKLHFVMKTLVLRGIAQESAELIRKDCLKQIERSNKWF